MINSEKSTTIFTFLNKNDYGVDDSCCDDIVFVRGLHTILSHLNIQDRKYITLRSQDVSSSAESERNDVDEKKFSLSIKVVQAVCVGYSRIKNNQSNKNQDLNLNTPHPDTNINININTNPEKPSNVDNNMDNVEERGSDVVISELIKSAAVAICLLASAEYEHQNIDRKKDRKRDERQTSTEDMSVPIDMKSKGVISNFSVRTGTDQGQGQNQGQGQGVVCGDGIVLMEAVQEIIRILRSNNTTSFNDSTTSFSTSISDHETTLNNEVVALRRVCVGRLLTKIVQHLLAGSNTG